MGGKPKFTHIIQYEPGKTRSVETNTGGLLIFLVLAWAHRFVVDYLLGYRFETCRLSSSFSSVSARGTLRAAELINPGSLVVIISFAALINLPKHLQTACFSGFQRSTHSINLCASSRREKDFWFARINLIRSKLLWNKWVKQHQFHFHSCLDFC